MRRQEAARAQPQRLFPAGVVDLYRTAIMFRGLYLPPIECVNAKYLAEVLAGVRKAYTLASVKRVYLPEERPEFTMENLGLAFRDPLTAAHLPPEDIGADALPEWYIRDIMRTTHLKEFDAYVFRVLNGRRGRRRATSLPVAKDPLYYNAVAIAKVNRYPCHDPLEMLDHLRRATETRSTLAREELKAAFAAEVSSQTSIVPTTRSTKQTKQP